MIRRYAEGTSVPADRTRNEIESLLTRHGATGFVFGSTNTPGGAQALVVFEMRDYRIRFLVPMPVASRKVTDNQVKAEVRRRWRALLLVLKAKLEAVASGIIEFSAEFLAHIVTSGGTTVGDQIIPGLPSLLSGGALPNLLGPGSM